MANDASNGARYMKFGLLDDGDDDGYNGIDLMGISIVFVKQDAFLFGSGPFHRIYEAGIFLALQRSPKCVETAKDLSLTYHLIVDNLIIVIFLLSYSSH